MGKHKIVKSAAAVALTASVVATAAAPGASAASYKVNSKDQLVYSKSGKLVKGWKVFGGKLYKNGKLAPAKKYKIIGSGAARQLFYGPTLKKGYKTAINKTLLFKDGKLADGWKQAGKNERLYKNGKLDKGYTVYTDVEGEKFLYQNGYLKKGQKTATRGGETLLFVDGKLAKGYVLHEASKTLYNNGKVAKGLVQYPEKDGKFYNDGKLANGEINGAEYKDGVLVAKDIASVKAINGTTVEVTFKEAQKADDVKAADYKIEGLEVKNAAVKQTDSKVVVLTTSAQEAAKEYTLVYKEADTKTFTGFNAALPTAIKANEIKVYQTSQQQVVGKEVTVKAVVTVAEGQSKAGIPVTFNIDNSNDSATGNFGEDKKVEVFTDENGVASYTYTQYASGTTDAVAAYATGKPDMRSNAVVRWVSNEAALLKVEAVTTDAELANNGTKVYKVKGTADQTYNVTFAENYEVTPDKVNRDAKIVDGEPVNVTPYQIAGSTEKAVQIKAGKDGIATFTVTGADTTVTPVVYVDSVLGTQKDRLNVSELQVTAEAAKFVDKKTVALTNEGVTAQKGSVAKATPGATYEANLGGRTYTGTYKDDKGLTAPAGTTVELAFSTSSNKFNADKTAFVNQDVYVYDNNNVVDGKVQRAAYNFTTKSYELVTDKDGKVNYTIVGTNKSAYATPVLFIDNGTGTNAENGLDARDTQAAADVVYFTDAVITKSEVKFYDANGKEIKDLKAGKPVTVVYQTLDQNGFPYTPEKAVNATNVTATFEFTTTFGKLTATPENGTAKEILPGSSDNKLTTVINPLTGQAIVTLDSTVASSVGMKVTAANAENSIAQGVASFSFTGLATTLDAVNAATDVTEMKDALANHIKLADEFAALTPGEKTAVAQEVLNKRTSAGYTETSLETAFKTAVKNAKDATDAATAASVQNQIAALTNTSDAAAVAAARAAFDALTPAQKALVTNEAALKAQEKRVALAKVDAGNAAKADYELLADQEVATELVPVLNKFFSTSVFAQTGTTGNYTDVTAPTEAEATVANVKSVVTAIKAATPENSTRDNTNDSGTNKAHKFSVDINTTNILALLTADGNVVTVTNDSANIIHLGTNKVYTFYALKADKTWIKVTADNTVQ